MNFFDLLGVLCASDSEINFDLSKAAALTTEGLVARMLIKNRLMRHQFERGVDRRTNLSNLRVIPEVDTAAAIGRGIVAAECDHVITKL